MIARPHSSSPTSKLMIAADLAFLEVHPEALRADSNKLWPYLSPQTEAALPALKQTPRT